MSRRFTVRAGRQPFNHDGIAVLVGGGNDQLHAGHVRHAELLFERLDVFPDRLLQLVDGDGAEALIINFNTGQTSS